MRRHSFCLCLSRPLVHVAARWFGHNAVVVFLFWNPMIQSALKLNRLNDDVCFVMHTQNTSGYQYIDVIWAQQHKRYSRCCEQLTPVFFIRFLLFYRICSFCSAFRRIFESKMHEWKKRRANRVRIRLDWNANAIVTWKCTHLIQFEFIIGSCVVVAHGRMMWRRWERERGPCALCIR